jgi:hypothetical protein
VGTVHYGTHEDVMAAAEIANQAARDRANRKGTCYTPARIAECTKGSDNRWTCSAVSANHPGSCFVGDAPISNGGEVPRFSDNPEEGEDAPEE